MTLRQDFFPEYQNFASKMFLFFWLRIENTARIVKFVIAVSMCNDYKLPENIQKPFYIP